MLVHEFDDLMDATPFKPFRVYTADGRSVLVRGREYAWHAPADRTVIIASGRGSRPKHIIDLHLVSRFTIGAKRKGDGDGNGNGNGKSHRRK